MKIISRSKRKSQQRASLLIEVTLGFGMLLVVSLLLLKAAISVTTVQQWTVIQGLSDARMSLEVAKAKRVPFNTFKAGGSDWPYNSVTTVSDVEIGKMPGGTVISGTLHRTRLPMANNLASAGGGGTPTTNPTGTEAWQLQSYLTYTISGRDYVKSRTVLRAR